MGVCKCVCVYHCEHFGNNFSEFCSLTSLSMDKDEMKQKLTESSSDVSESPIEVK